MIGVGMLLFINLDISRKAKYHLWGKYVVAIIIGPCVVCSSTAKKSVSRPSIDLCFMQCFTDIAETIIKLLFVFILYHVYPDIFFSLLFKP